MFTGLLSGVFTAHVLGMPRALQQNGLYGFNAVLVGQAGAVFLAFDAPGALPTAAALVALFAALSTIVTEALGSLLVPVHKVPPFTLAFNIATLLLLALAGGTASNRMQLADFLAPAPATGHVLVQGGGPDPSAAAAEALFDSVLLPLEVLFRGVAQVYLCNSAAAGVGVVIGIAVWSPIAAAFAMLGSALGSLSAVAIGSSASSIVSGMGWFWWHHRVWFGTFSWPCGYMQR